MLDKSTMTSLLARMESQGLIAKEESRQDKRAVHIRLTEQGRAMADAVKVIFQAADERTLQGIPAEERQTLTRLLQTVISNLEEEAE